VVTSRLPTLPRRFGPEDGSMLVEVLVSALLVGVMAAAFFGALSGASRVSGTSKARAIAAGLAQNDQERLRSMPVAALNELNTTATKPVAGVDYQVTSKAEWVADATQSNTDCTANGAAADYMRITSTVVPKNIASLAPVVVTSTVTPAPGTFNNLGALVVSVVDRNGVGESGRTVNISGPANDSAVTNQQGCAFFGYEPVGDYNVTTSAVGYVDSNGNSIGTTTASVGNETTASAQIMYDLAGAATLTFDTKAKDATGALESAPQPAPAWTVTVNHGGLTKLLGPGYPTGSPYTSPVPATSIAAPKLFPFTDPYGIYAGDCTWNDPGTLTPAPTGSSLTVIPGKLDHAVTVRMPAVNVLTKAGGVAKALPVTITSATASCGVWTVRRTTAPSGTPGTSTGMLQDPGLPYGQYFICVYDSAQNRRLTTGMPLTGSTPLTTSTVPIANTVADGTPVAVFNVTGSSPSQSGSCP
jgi:Tfp pilus assembly protein PilV